MTAESRPAASRTRLAALVLLLAVGAGGVWWWSRPAPLIPPLPPDIQDAEVSRAVERARQEVSADPRSATAWGNLGMTLLAHLFDREADRSFAEAARLDPNEPQWPYARALIALKRDPEQAVPLLRQAVAAAERTSQSGPFRVQLAEALLERHEVEEAERLFRDEGAGPSNPRAALGLGQALLVQGKRAAAVEAFEAARNDPSSRKQATSQLAALARQGGVPGDYEKEAVAMPDDQVWPDPLLDRIVLLQVGRRGRERKVGQLEKQRRFAEAVREYLEQIAIEPTAKAHIGAGINLARLKEYDQALAHLREGVRLEGDNAQGHYTLALVLFSMAEREWQHAPGSERAKAWFGEAARHGRRAAELKPDHARAYLSWGLALKYLGKPTEAVVALRKGVGCRPEDFELQLALGGALVDAGRAEEAKTYLENARSLDGKDPRPGEILGRLRQKQE